LPADFTLNLQIVGLTHLIVASGFHLTTVVRAGKRIGEKRSRRWALALGLLAIGLFTMITGVSSSMTRAGLVSLISLISWYYGRQSSAGRILLLVLGLTVLINPLYLWGDASFYLSFGAFAGVLLLGPIMRQYFWGKTKLRFVPQLLTESLSAQIATLPISVFFFGKLSTVALLTNLLVVPVASLLMLLSLLASLLGTVPGVGVILIWPLQLILNYVIGVTNWFAGLPLAQIDLTINLWQVILAYTVIIGVAIYMAWRNQRDAKLAEALKAFNVIE
jgi:competence protein ComEC